MASHSFHPDTHEFGLADDCPRCDEHAEHPVETLDDENLLVLMERVTRDEEPRSDNEAQAMRRILEARRHSAKLNQLRVVK